MSQKIGYQDGIAWFVGWVRKVSLGTVRWRPMNERPASLEQWYGLEKFERTIRILKDDHDAAITTDPPPPPPPPPTLWFPRTYNKVLPNGQDARYCVSASDPAFLKIDGGLIWDKGGASYDVNGLCVNGARSADMQVPGLKPANEMDGRGACDPYGSFPPWPEGSYVR